MRGFGRVIRARCLNISAELRRVALWRGIAQDASEKQIANAEPHERVEYRVAPAEESGLESGTIDLIMVAQALHWLGLPRFYEEVPRVLKSNGVFAASAYKLLHIHPDLARLATHRYY